VLILAWIAWSMIKPKTAGIADCLASHDAPGSGGREAAADLLPKRTDERIRKL
jgi:hypothetical protein